ncbi:TIGR01777 family protein [Serinibacter arcticus]|uniref:TIGR01777 family protein n=1 Tax=Serinibacter arcticus TaxID=1655435 RepID=A0A2U1ZSB3_9MICO|nr:TIGR01777 family oxidoreductase [Serinibacter arcticus]PWD49866.1 TIGR01777 family protein [Serinibacter arcticus]
MSTDQPGATVLVGGASGLIGSPLVAHLEATGTRVRRLVRRPASGPDEVTWAPEDGVLPDSAFDGVSAVVVLSGAGVADKRWTSSRRRELLRSRTSTTSLIARRMAEVGGPRRLVAGSAVGFYADRDEEELTETSGPGEGFLAELTQAWEAAAQPARDAGLSVAHARTGLVLTPDGGALGRLLPLLRLGVAGPMGHGRQWWPWITLTDEVRALAHLVTSDVTGPVNLTAPEPLRNAELTRVLARALNRPATVPVPGIALRIGLGGFAAELLNSQRVLPTVLEADGFVFTHPRLEAAAAELVG